ncbi:MAG: hypothetical protein FWH27_01600 [Planctomycetaceae bacterium]|nr:hypothetical protein [Planctomycetaceae bacterium]
MTVTKSKQSVFLLPMFLLTFAMTQGLSNLSSVFAQENGTSKSLLSIVFSKQQPSLLEKGNPATSASDTQVPAPTGAQKLSQVQIPNDVANRRVNGRASHAMFNINMPPINAETSPIVSVSGLVPMNAGDQDLHTDQQPRQLRRFPVEPDPNDIPSIVPIEKPDRSDVISNPVLDPSHTNDDSFSLASAMQNNSRAAGTQRQVPTPDDHSSDAHLHEINVSAMKSAMFNGIQPGVTLKNEVIERMEGPPNLVTPVDAVTEVLIYDLGELGRMEITIQQSKVFSIVWLLPEPYPSEQIRKEGLESELRGIRAIHVPDSNGYILGMIFPEKGVIFSFVKSNEPGVPLPMVTQVIVEPLTSWPFELRGERYLTISNAKAKWDLTIAVQLDPNNHRARWLLAKAFLADDQLVEAQRECKFAIQLMADQPQYHVTLAEIIGTAGYTKEARQYLDSLMPYCSNSPQLKGHVEYLLGDFYRDDSSTQDLLAASKYYETAINTVKPLLESTNPTLRQQAKLILMKTYLSMAQSISLSNWGGKEESLPPWLDGAETFALNMVMDDNTTREYLLEVAVKTIGVHANCPELGGLEKAIDKLQKVTDEIVSQTDDESTVRRIENQYASALYDIGQVYEERGDMQQATQYAKKAIQYFERNLSDNDDVASIYRLANLYYQLGTLEASGQASRPPVKPDKKAHARAAGWFAKAIPLFQQIEASLDQYEQPVLGQMYVSIGVTYWEVGEKSYAVQITEYGVGKLEDAVDNELIAGKILATPYINLSNMYEEMGRKDEAESYYLLSKQAANNNLAGGSSTKKTR